MGHVKYDGRWCMTVLLKYETDLVNFLFLFLSWIASFDDVTLMIKMLNNLARAYCDAKMLNSLHAHADLISKMVTNNHVCMYECGMIMSRINDWIVTFTSPDEQLIWAFEASTLNCAPAHIVSTSRMLPLIRKLH